MIIKKHQPGPSQKWDHKKRLEAYAQQGYSYRKTHKGNPARSSALLKSTLAAVIPLAAAGGVQAQCQGATAGISSNTTNYVTLDIDGMAPYNDLKIFFIGGDFTAFSAANGFYVQSGSVTALLNSGFIVTRGQTFVSTTFRCGDCSSTGFFKVRKGDGTTGQPGWVKVSLSPLNFQVLERGIEIDNDNSAVTGQCNTLAAAMPVEMTHFQVSPQNQDIQLDWATASELNNEGFEVQRSTDGRSFAKVGWVNGNGTTNEEQAYRFTDDEVQPNTKYYYRLQQMDTNGTSDFSPVRSAMVEDASMVQVSELFPNPVGRGRAAARFHLHMPEDGQLDIQVFDARGGLVNEMKREYTAGRNTLAVPTRDLPAGQYFVKMQLGKEVLYRKLLVK